MYSIKLSGVLLAACLGLNDGWTSPNLDLRASHPDKTGESVVGCVRLAKASQPLSDVCQQERRATKNKQLTAHTKQAPSAESCPSDVEALTALLIRDLPGYANRVIQRSRRLSRTVDTFPYVIVAGKPEFEPLTLGPGLYTSVPSATDLEPPQQVFLTTLERQYRRDKATETQHYHWLFLTQTPSGWRLAMMFSRIGSSSGTRPPTPPRESSNGVIGQAVSTWLRDCRTGTLRPS
jgi:hypothetical protein